MTDIDTPLPIGASKARIATLEVDANDDALNAGLCSNGIATEQVITILDIPAHVMAQPRGERWRVFYRA